MESMETTYGLEEPKVPHWAKFSVVIGAPDGYHHKYYQGFVRARMEFERQLGHPPVNYWAERMYQHLEKLSKEEQDKRIAEWSLEKYLETVNHFEAVDDYGRTISIEKIGF